MISSKKNVLKYSVMLLLMLGMFFVLVSCYPNGPSATGELDVVATFYDNQADFGKIRTFGMPDSIVHIKDSTNKDIEISRQYDAQILAQVRSSLERLGYEYLDETEIDTIKPDVIVTVAARAQENYSYSYSWWGYWGWYPGWGYWPGYGPGWGYGYPWYGGTTVYQYKTGTLFIDMVDPERNDDENKQIPSIWVAAINGLLEGSTTGTVTRLQTTIDQAFIQSPYLGAQ